MSNLVSWLITGGLAFAALLVAGAMVCLADGRRRRRRTDRKRANRQWMLGLRQERS